MGIKVLEGELVHNCTGQNMAWLERSVKTEIRFNADPSTLNEDMIQELGWDGAVLKILEEQGLLHCSLCNMAGRLVMSTLVLRTHRDQNDRVGHMDYVNLTNHIALWE